MTTKQTYTKRVGLKKIHVKISVEHRSHWDMNANRDELVEFIWLKRILEENGYEKTNNR